jgi:hypothetical protein
VSVTTECTLELSLIDFRRAIAAVRPHAERSKSGDDITAYSRIRMIADATELHVVATNGSTTAMASVKILSDSRTERFAADDAELGSDISPVLAADLRSGLRIRRSDLDEASQIVAVAFTQERVTVTDVSGLWPGSSTTRPLLPYATDYPAVHDDLRRALGAAGEAIKPITAQGGLLTLFAAAARQYDRPLQVEPSGPSDSRAFVVWCGTAFIGAVSSGHDDDDSLTRRQSERRAHLERLGLTPVLLDA